MASTTSIVEMNVTTVSAAIANRRIWALPET
jgi:hypothetical protein